MGASRNVLATSLASGNTRNNRVFPFFIFRKEFMSQLAAVFDIDDTLCDNRNRDYENALPKRDVIKKLNQLHRSGYKIVLYTSRGMVSCGGDREKAEKKNLPVLEKWLADNNVEYDEIVFGKPIADLYVDDRGMNTEDFLKADFESLQGGSGKSVVRIGNVVKKDLGSEDKLLKFQQFVKNNRIFRIPKIYSYTYNEVYMQYIKGFSLADCCIGYDIKQVIDKIDDERRVKLPYTFDLKKQIDVLEKNRVHNTDNLIDISEQALQSIENTLIENRSFMHGDLTLGNIIAADYDLYFLDPVFEPEASSYIFDMAKLKMSLDGYEYIFGLGRMKPSEHLRSLLKEYAMDIGRYTEMVICELMYVLRLYRYKDAVGRKSVIEFAERIIKENEGIFE